MAQGYRLGSPTVALLRRHVQCALAAECPTAESLRQGVVASVGNWWGLPPTKAEGLGLECYDSSVAKLWSDEFETGDEKDDEEDDGARGAGAVPIVSQAAEPSALCSGGGTCVRCAVVTRRQFVLAAPQERSWTFRGCATRRSSR